MLLLYRRMDNILRFFGRYVKSPERNKSPQQNQTRKRNASRVRSQTQSIKKKNTSSKTKSAVSSKAKPEFESEIVCKRSKRSYPVINTVDLLSRPANSYESNIPPLKEEELDRRVESINDGPHYVTLTVKPKTHTIFVNITKDKIFIADWNGDIRTVGLKYIDGKKNPEYLDKRDKKWEQYSKFIQLLQEKNDDKPVEYYDVDEELYDKADKKAEEGGGGGCAEYVYEWVAKHKDKLF